MPNAPSIDQLRRTVRQVTGSGQFQAHQIACQLQENPEALQLAQAIEQALRRDLSGVHAQEL